MGSSFQSLNKIGNIIKKIVHDPLLKTKFYELCDHDYIKDNN